jgi:hypothetical protein
METSSGEQKFTQEDSEEGTWLIIEQTIFTLAKDLERDAS